MEKNFASHLIPSYKTVWRYMKEIIDKFGLLSFAKLEKISNTKDGNIYLRSFWQTTIITKNQPKKLIGLIWITSWMSSMLNKCEHIYFDGTFKFVPHPFKQVMIILGRD